MLTEKLLTTNFQYLMKSNNTIEKPSIAQSFGKKANHNIKLRNLFLLYSLILSLYFVYRNKDLRMIEELRKMG